MWAILAILSASLLGVYDVFKKLGVKENAVLPVLFFSAVSGSVLVTPVFIGSRFYPEAFQSALLYVPMVDGITHLKLFIKACIVVSSWIFVFAALKHLPITIVTPIRATGPIWTLVGAITIFGERLSVLQWSGLVVTLVFFYMFSVAGKTEGIVFRKNKWVLFVVLGTMIGAASGLYDKYLTTHIDRMAVQVYFTYYQVVVMLVPLALFWWPRRHSGSPFQWRIAIPLISFFLLLADYLYFFALSYQDSLIAVVSALRRGGIVVAFAIGAFVFKEKNIRKKAVLLAGIMVGILLLILGSH